MLRLIVTTFLLCSLSSVAMASDRVKPLLDALRIREMILLMREEGLSYGDELAVEFFGDDRAPTGWDAAVDSIYSAERMESELESGFSDQMDGVDVTSLLTFFTSELGEEVVELELSAREAFLDPAFEEAATELMIDLSIAGDARLLWVKEFSEMNDLVEENVVGALNANLAFFQGLAQSGGDMGLNDKEMLRDVWAQEEDIRRSTEDWLYSYLMTAYHTLDDKQLADYLAVTQTPEGRAMTRALFAGFDTVFVEISRDLGAAAARYLGSEEL